MLLFIPHYYGTTEVRLFMEKDGEGGFGPLFPEWCALSDGMDVFSCSMEPNSIGLYWYYFEADTFYGLMYTRAEGGLVSMVGRYEDMLPLQLTVYERAYEVPSYMKGGMIYQVFPDRFYRELGAGGEDAFENAGSGSSGREASCKGNISAKDAGSRTAADDEKAFNLMKEICLNDPVKGKYHIRRAGETYNNRFERSMELHGHWGGEPVWRTDMNGEILNNDFFGGNLNGVKAKIPYLKELGVTCIYLNPVFESFTSHRYDTGDYLKIDPLLGTEEDFKELCSAAKEAGMAVMLDGVFNHTGDDSIYFNKYGTYSSHGAAAGESSEYYGWYDWQGGGRYNSWWGITTLPTVNKNSEGLKNLLFKEDGVIRKWIRLGAAGWRLDVVDELPSGFLKELVKAAKTEKSDAVILGEVWEDASNKIAYGVRRSYFQGEELDSVMNYPWKDAILSFMRDGNASGLSGSVADICANYPPEVISCLMNPLGTHDSVRAITALAGKDLAQSGREAKANEKLSKSQMEHGIRLMMLSVLLQFVLPGVPSIYYGDETGMEGYNDPFNRRCFDWGNTGHVLHEWYLRLGKYRNNEREFFSFADAGVLNSQDGVFSFIRTYGARKLFCAVNRGKEEASMELAGKWVPVLKNMPGEVFGGSITPLKDLTAITIPAEYGWVLAEQREGET